MAYTDKVPEYVIDLNADEYDRWEKVIKKDSKAVAALADSLEEDLGYVHPFLKSLIRGGTSIWYRLASGMYAGEMRSWADALERPLSEVVLMNCIYELSHVDIEGFVGSIFGCTTGCRWVPGVGMVHVRTLDWPIEGIGKNTRIFRFVDNKREFVTVGIAGFVGVLSGMVPGGYSVTINWAPPNGNPGTGTRPAFLLRKVLEECDTYAEAKKVLTNTRVSTPVFFTLCGIKKGEACVIERQQNDAHVRNMRGDSIVHANHHLAADMRDNNDEDMLDFSRSRAQAMSEELSLVRGKSLDDIGGVLADDPIENEDTCQRMVFVPKTGAFRAWRWV